MVDLDSIRGPVLAFLVISFVLVSLIFMAFVFQPKKRAFPGADSFCAAPPSSIPGHLHPALRCACLVLP